MASKPGLVARLFGRGRAPVVTQLYSHALGQPLLVDPAHGEALIGAYLSGAVDAPVALVEHVALMADGASVVSSEAVAAPVVAVLNISGALVNRPMPDVCGPGPVSYEAIGKAFDAAIADDSVKAVVLRLASPGGMAAGCFDLSDRMHAARGKKPVYAMVDDYAYSACYGLAAAADEIWITRTGGVGSVGVVCFHYDQSGYDGKVGLKVTPIYSGARKVDFNPHAPLSDEALAHAKGEVDRLYELFVTSVATYRGINADAVRATEAATFHGPAAVAAGFADRVGTMRDLLAHIEAATTATADDDTSDADDNDADPVAPTGADPAARRLGFIDAVSASALAPDLVKALIGVDAGAADVAERIAHAQAIADLCAAAGLRSVAPGYVSRHADLDQVRAELDGARADAGPEVVTALATGPAVASATATRHDTVYSRRRAAAAGTGT